MKLFYEKKILEQKGTFGHIRIQIIHPEWHTSV